MVDQCVKGEGLVQINAQVRTNTRRINIVDVLKPTDDALAEISEMMKRSSNEINNERSGSESPQPDAATVAAAAAIERELAAVPSSDMLEENSMCTPDDVPVVATPPSIDIDEDDSSAGAMVPQVAKPQWIIDTQFKKDQIRLKISDDPREWFVHNSKWFSNFLPKLLFFFFKDNCTGKTLVTMGCSSI